MPKLLILDPTIKDFVAKLTSQKTPPIYTLSPDEARNVLLNVQGDEHSKTDYEKINIPGGPSGHVTIRIVRPKHHKERLPIVLYFHGGGWILGDFSTHERLLEELANGSQAAIVYVDYSRSPEARYPVALEECYHALHYIFVHGKNHHLDSSRIAVAGDSVGGNLATVVALLAKERGGPHIEMQALLYPVTDSNFSTESYDQFAEGPWLTRKAMEWFWNAYEPSAQARTNPNLSPLQANLDQLKGMPKTFIITNENDVLRDEGEAYAHKLMQANVKVTAVRYIGSVHDLLLLNPISQSQTAKSALAQTCEALRCTLNEH